jgi:hypothetical protein
MAGLVPTNLVPLRQTRRSVRRISLPQAATYFGWVPGEGDERTHRLDHRIGEEAIRWRYKRVREDVRAPVVRARNAHVR